MTSSWNISFNSVNCIKLKILTAEYPATQATMQQSSKCKHNIIILVAGKPARVGDYMFTVKLNDSAFCGSTYFNAVWFIGVAMIHSTCLLILF